MPIGFGSREDDVATLIAKRQYAKAIEIIRAQLKRGRPDPRLRLQLADVLALAGKEREAVSILLPLADEFAQEGFAAKAISVLKKIQKLDPSRYDIDARLAELIETKQRLAKVPLPGRSSGRNLEIGIEEIAPVSAPAVRTQQPFPETGPASAVPSAAPSPPENHPLPFLFRTPERPLPPPVEDLDLVAMETTGDSPEPLANIPNFASREEFRLDDADLDLIEEGPFSDGTSAPLNPLADAAFADEILSIIDEVLPAGGSPAPLPPNGDSGATQIVVSPLFKDFSVDEMVAVIQGLRLLSFRPRQVIIRQGDRGDSLYMLTSGRVRAFKKDEATGRQVPLADLEEGAFFGEVSILTGKPRMATIVAATPCELLELDRATLQSIAAKHPHVWDVMEDFARQRLKGSLR